MEKEKTRANLLRAVSHDIRTPLTSIQASASGILDNYDALGRQEKVELLEGIRDESRWLIRMVENLLSITRINGDRAQLQTTWEVVEEVVGGAVGKFQKQFAQIEVETSMPEEVVMAPMDGILVEQVLVNLMENSAIHGKTTTKIRISIQKLPERVLFCVEDNGKGIADYFRRTASDRRSCCERWKTEHGDRTIGLHEHYSGASGRHEGGKYGGAQGSEDPVLAALSGRKLDGGSLNGSKGQNSDYRG